MTVATKVLPRASISTKTGTFDSIIPELWLQGNSSAHGSHEQSRGRQMSLLILVVDDEPDVPFGARLGHSRPRSLTIVHPTGPSYP